MADERRHGERRKSPAFSMYPKDYLSSEDITLMSPAAEGLYNRCLMLSWDNGGLPVEPANVLKLVGTKFAKCWKSAWPQVRKKFVERGGRLVNLRQEQERERQQLRSKQAKQAASQRWEDQRDLLLTKDADADANASESHMRTPVTEHGPPQSLAVAVADKSKPAAPKKLEPWTRPFGVAWEARFAGTIPWGLIGSALKPLRATHTDEVILDRFKRYLASTSAQFVNLPKFAQTFGDWAVTKPNGKGLRDSYLTPAELP